MSDQSSKPSRVRAAAEQSLARPGLAPQMRMMFRTFWASPERNKILLLGVAIVAVIGLTAVGIAQFTSSHPVIKLRLLRNRSYASVVLIIISIGMVLYDILYVLPQFLGVIAGYNAEQAEIGRAHV